MIVLGELRKVFRPEMLNRIDEVVTFRPLDETDVRRIARPLYDAEKAFVLGDA